ncbi:MMPL family transporter [Actinomadura oligospora]|uniref:MMPL family transporter n=1 Tax=Actinomadura oligospora TaxID=111804 RepID=UPI0004B5ADC2|nr:MMPL family transporter [Actinomadura oligospora]
MSENPPKPPEDPTPPEAPTPPEDATPSEDARPDEPAPEASGDPLPEQDPETTSEKPSEKAHKEATEPVPAPAEARRAVRRPVVERVAAWSARHKWWAITAWFGLVVVAFVLSGLVTGDQAHTTGPGEAGLGQKILNEQKVDGAARENVLVQERTPGAPFASDPKARQAAQDLVTALRATPASGIMSPLDPGSGRRLISSDGRSGLVVFELTGTDDEKDAKFDATRKAVDDVRAKYPDLRVAQAGDRSISKATDEVYGKDFERSEVLSLPLTLLILVVVFGALIAAGIPVLLSLSAVVATVSLVQVIKQFMPINSTVASMVLLIGMAVGVDYSLFYLRREREERAAGRSVGEALRITARTSGRAVVMSGITVMLCLSGLFLTGIDVFRGMAVGTLLVVGLTVVGSVTVLPALLSALGRWVDRGRIPWLGRRRTAAGESRAWAAIARSVVRRPVLFGGAAALLLALLAIPAFGMRLQDPSLTNDLPRSNATVDAAARIQEAFPGGPSPAEVVVWGDQVNGPAVKRAVDGLHEQAAASGGALGEPIQVDQVGEALVVNVPLAGSGSDAASTRALKLLRERALPETLGKVDGIHYAVTGKTAGPHDFAARLHGRSPVVFAFVLAPAFVLLLAAFRSVAIPLVSIALNLLSVGAAYGVVTWVFQDGHLTSVFDFTSYGAVLSWLPLFMFVMLFGLSMDYHIFILSRIRERRLGGAGHRDSIIGGIASSAGVVTSAAVVMVAVFSIFTTLSAIEYKMFGVGMSVAILLDATIVRGVLLPAIMSLLGRATWAMPTWLHWLPGDDAPTAAAPSPKNDPDHPETTPEPEPNPKATSAAG